MISSCRCVQAVDASGCESAAHRLKREASDLEDMAQTLGRQTDPGRQLLVVQQVTASTSNILIVECDKARKSLTVYDLPHNARLTATRVAPTSRLYRRQLFVEPAESARNQPFAVAATISEAAAVSPAHGAARPRVAR